MKKLIIAAGIAAATMASFNASAVIYDTNNVSHASVNSVVTGSSVVTVTGQDGGSFNTTEILDAGKTLGTFTIALPDNKSVAGFGISGIHSHGFPNDFVVKFNDCKVKVTSDAMTRVDGQDPLGAGHTSQACVFANSVKSVAVTTETNTAAVEPGTKTITADFTAYTN
ncbi:hypothetical protein EX404_18785 [Salmonella enterica]|nr:hypothetical protein [Salmonella enterica]EEE1377772.1 hypothetical protein [Salmonella enterica subsp. diarizonae]EAQ1550197.1 hypothetical protein [Salmonella enterica]EAS0546850.1 hypothetical protein [Salmonella enterica]EBG6879629.1 hypothetical protein [Salmonella enterica]